MRTFISLSNCNLFSVVEVTPEVNPIVFRCRDVPLLIYAFLCIAMSGDPIPVRIWGVAVHRHLSSRQD